MAIEPITAATVNACLATGCSIDERCDGKSVQFTIPVKRLDIESDRFHPEGNAAIQFHPPQVTEIIVANALR